MHFASWCKLSKEQLATRDIAEMNLAAAFGLPMAGLLDVRKLCQQIDSWSQHVRQETRKMHRVRVMPEYRDWSEARFRMLVLTTVLQRDFGVRYNHRFAQGDYDARDSRNLFLHGLLTGRGGTCVSMPVLYAAVGRRLGYPIKLVEAKEHIFCRWDGEDGERFNIEATARGFHDPSDDYYQTFPVPLSARDLASGLYLRSLTPREELALFLGQRGSCCFDHLQLHQAALCFGTARDLAPNYPQYEHARMKALVVRRALPKVQQAMVDGHPVTDALMPAPIEPWEKQYYPFALRELRRILQNRKERPMDLSIPLDDIAPQIEHELATSA